MLVAHGSTVNSQSSAPTRRLADELRGRGEFAQVVAAFNLESPRIGEVLDTLDASRVFVVPITISEGHFTEETIPRLLGLSRPQAGTDTTTASSYPRVQTLKGRRVHYCHPVGTHPSMTDVLLGRAREVVNGHGALPAATPDRTALFIAGHGTTKNSRSRESIEAQVTLIEQRGEYAEVHAVFMEEHPFIKDCLGMSSQPHLVVVPFFIADGLHTVEDIPVLLGESAGDVAQRLADGQPTWRNPTMRNSQWVWYAHAIGDEPHLPEVILQRVREMAQA